MANTDMTYCDGKGCVLREQCSRYIDSASRMVTGKASTTGWTTATLRQEKDF